MKTTTGYQITTQLAKNTLSLLLVVFLVFQGCSTQTERTAPTSVESKTDSVQHTYAYEPENYEETIKDTILNPETDLRLYIKHYSQMDKGFEVEFDFGAGQHHTAHYRDYAVAIKLTAEQQVLFNETIEKELFQNKIQDKHFLSQAYLSGVELEEFNNSTGQVSLRIWLVMVETDYAHIFQLDIDPQGNQTIELVETT